MFKIEYRLRQCEAGMSSFAHLITSPEYSSMHACDVISRPQNMHTKNENCSMGLIQIEKGKVQHGQRPLHRLTR